MSEVYSNMMSWNCHHNLETFSLLWLDADVDRTEENRQAQRKLRQIINHLRKFDDANQCQQYILYCSNQDRLILIVSGRLGRLIVPNIHHLRQISAIYVYCADKKLNEQWAKHYTKVRNVLVHIDELIKEIQFDQANRKTIDEPLAMNIYTMDDKQGCSTDDVNGGFVHSLLLIDVLLRMKSNDQDKRQLIKYCVTEYEGNDEQLQLINEFDRTYLPQHALYWYARESFVHKILNRALRVQNIELLFFFRFLIHDIYKQLKANQCAYQIRVYRGQLMSIDELNKLQQSKNKFISINSFFSTSIEYESAWNFLNCSYVSYDLRRILFIIHANPSKVTTKPFADISRFSPHDEKEVLFMIGCVFHIIRIYQDGPIWIIEMELCGDNEHNVQHLFEHLRKQYAGGNQQVNLRSFAAVLQNMGKNDLAELVYHRVLNETPFNDPKLPSVYQSLGMIYDDKHQYDKSLTWYQKALDVQMKNDPSNYQRIGAIYCCIGVVYKNQKHFNTALDYYRQAIDLYYRANDSNHLNVASFYNNIAIIYNNQKQYSEALKYYDGMLEIERRHLVADHPDLGKSYNNIGLVYLSLGNYDFAMQYFQYSLDIKLKGNPSDHPVIASSYVNMAHVYEAQHNLQQALLYFQKAATIRHKSLPSNDPDVIKIDQYIQRIQSKLRH